jgi:ATP-dependent Lon protease
MNDEITAEKNVQIPILPLRDVVVFPNMVIPLFVGRLKSIKALEAAMLSGQKKILLLTQKTADIDDPGSEDLYRLGVQANVLQLLKLPDGTVKVLVEGGVRAKVVEFIDWPDYLSATVEPCKTSWPLSEQERREIEALERSLISCFDQYVKLNKKVPADILSLVGNIKEADRLCDIIAAHLSLKVPQKQELLEVDNLKLRIEKLLSYVEAEIELSKIDKRIRGRVEQQMKKSHREYYLNEQMKAIKKELGGSEESPNEIEELREKVKKSGMSKEAMEKAEAEINKLKMMPPMSAEATVSRNYLDWLLAVPWKKESKVKIDLKKAENILNQKHYGLEKIKERFIEYLAVQQRVNKIKGSILCLVGPPGVGKTSLGQSIAEATGREFTRVSLGGVRDEAEIRGHRRTYIGSMPGKIIQKLSKVGVKNPLFMLDEIDKMAMDFRGDPASALLEVLDPEQNHAFNDHYLEVDYDLSSVMFIATANTLDIPHALLDRMEVIFLSGYTEDEKINIAIKYLIPKQMEANGLKANELQMSESAVRDIMRYYTREAGVRNLEREVSKICRKVVKEILTTPNKKIKVDHNNLENYLGVRHYRYGVADVSNQVGQVTGLAWTEVGGELLKIEASVVPGKARTILTGQLGEVMQESIQAAMTVVRAHAKELKVSTRYFENHDIHIHLPEGAIPKDGPSAGVGMCTVIASVLTGVPVRADMAMTGEITLRGEILPIGGLKEKLLAALRGGIREVLIPEENKKDLKEIPDNVKKQLKIHTVRWIDEVFVLAFQTPLKISVKKNVLPPVNVVVKKAKVKKAKVKKASKAKASKKVTKKRK